MSLSLGSFKEVPDSMHICQDLESKTKDAAYRTSNDVKDALLALELDIRFLYNYLNSFPHCNNSLLEENDILILTFMYEEVLHYDALKDNDISKEELSKILEIFCELDTIKKTIDNATNNLQYKIDNKIEINGDHEIEIFEFIRQHMLPAIIKGEKSISNRLSY